MRAAFLATKPQLLSLSSVISQSVSKSHAQQQRAFALLAPISDAIMAVMAVICTYVFLVHNLFSDHRQNVVCTTESSAGTKPSFLPLVIRLFFPRFYLSCTLFSALMPGCIVVLLCFGGAGNMGKPKDLPIPDIVASYLEEGCVTVCSFNK